MAKGPLGIWNFPILTRLVTRVVSENTFTTESGSSEQGGENKEPPDEEQQQQTNTVVVREIERVPVPVEKEDSGIEFPTQEGTEKENRAVPVEREDRDETVFIEQKDVTLTDRVDFEPSSEDIEGDVISSPIQGQGVLKSFLVVVDSDQFQPFVEIDNSDVIREPFTEIQQVSSELEDISAYEDSGKFVFSIQDYPFQDFASVGIKPEEVPITIERIRVELET